MVKKKKLLQNPFSILFVCLALVCLILFSLVFFYIFRSSNREMQKNYFQEKIEVVTKDLDLQINALEKLALTLSIDSRYQSSSLQQDKYNEIIMLEDFKTYRFTCVLSDELFLYYEPLNSNAIYHSNGYVIDLDVYLRFFPQSEKESIINTLQNLSQPIDFLPLSNEIFILIPLKSRNAGNASLICSVSSEELEKRIQMISGGLIGTYSLYYGDIPLYCNSETDLDINHAQILSTASSEHNITFYYLPKYNSFVYSYNQILFQIFLFIADLLVVLAISQVLSQRAYHPLKELRNKYQNDELKPDESSYNNIFSEIDHIIDNAIHQSIDVADQLEKKQDILKQVVLRHLLNGGYFSDIPSNVDKLGILLPGPYFYVICLSFLGEPIDDDFLFLVRKEIDKMSTTYDQEYAYAVCNPDNAQLWIICSIQNKEHKKEMTEFVAEIAESFSYQPKAGIGQIYDSLSKLPASWIESIENLGKDDQYETEKNFYYTYNSHDLQGLENALTTASEDDAFKWLEQYTKKLQADSPSLLMQQYIFSLFTMEICKLSKKNSISLSNQGISLLVSSKNITNFHDAAKDLIFEYRDKYQKQMQVQCNNQSHQICEYIRQHFLEYDNSIEKFSEDLNVTTTTVRSAVKDITGKTYKEYLVQLRIDYSIQLLNEGELSVAEISQAVGYNCVSYFIRVFKEVTGTTPAKYKKG